MRKFLLIILIVSCDSESSSKTQAGLVTTLAICVRNGLLNFQFFIYLSVTFPFCSFAITIQALCSELIILILTFLTLALNRGISHNADLKKAFGYVFIVFFYFGLFANNLFIAYALFQVYKEEKTERARRKYEMAHETAMQAQFDKSTTDRSIMQTQDKQAQGQGGMNDLSNDSPTPR